MPKSQNITIAGLPQTFVAIGPTTFRMGSPEGEPGRFADEGPQHEVTLTQKILMANTTVTEALWEAVMRTNPSKGGPNRPVTRVSWDDVQQFLEKIQQFAPEGYRFDLPTEAEWECACRAGTTTPYSTGDTLTPEQANIGNHIGHPVDVKSYPPNPWGLYAMHGDVWEWCKDSLRTYTADAVTDPGR